jgi:uncharacterized protein (TIGR03067 family)
MAFVLVGWLLVLASSSADSPADWQRKKLEGTWVVTKVTVRSDRKLKDDPTEKMLDGARFTFKGDQVTYRAGDEKEQTGTYTLVDPESRAIDFPWQGKTVKGLYRFLHHGYFRRGMYFRDTTLTICFDRSGKQRPRSFVVGPDYPLNCLITLKRLPQKRAADPVKEKERPKLSEAHIKWAQGVAEDVIAAALKGKSETTTTLVVEEQRKSVSRWFHFTNPETAGHVSLHFTYTGFKIDSSLVSPEQDEIVFKGKLTGRGGAGDFSIRVTRDKDRKWRVCFFRWELPTKK